MEDGDLVQRYKLNVSVLGDRNREILSAPTEGRGREHGTITKIWQRRRALAQNVYLEESQFGELRAIKQVHWRDFKGDQSEHQAMNLRGLRIMDLRELQVMRRVTEEKAFFVQFFGWFLTQDHVSFAMEYCLLGDVSQCFDAPVSEIMARDMCGQLLEGLGKLHEMGITHRDIKPQNILVVRMDPVWVKIGDFGISKSLVEGRATAPRTRVGTHGYMAPEVSQLLDDEKEDSAYTFAVDIWSLGCFLYYVLTKTTPFTDMTLREFCLGRIAFPEASLTNWGVCQSGRYFIQGLMAIYPDKRPQASKELVSNWVITKEDQTPEINILKGTSREEVRLVKRPEYVIDQLAVNANGNVPSYAESLRNISNLDDEMNYQSSKLWYMVRDAEADIGRVQSLLESGANPNKFRNGYTALHNAAERGSTRGVELLITYGSNAQLKTRPHQETVLHLATYNDNISKVRLLVKQRVNVDTQNVDGDTTLHLAVLRCLTTEALELLLSNGASTEIKGRNGYTPLQYAISLGLEEKARLLLENGADPNAQDQCGRTPLHQAIASDKITSGFIISLVESGANVDHKDTKNHSPLYEAARCDRQDIIQYLVHGDAGCEIESLRSERRFQCSQFRKGLLWLFGK